MNKQILLTTLSLAAASIAGAQTQLGPLVDEDTTLPRGTEWLLDGVTYVTPGTTLTIEPGVTVYAEDGSGAAASTLIVTSGATIDAQGTAEEPIVFTSIQARDTELDHNDVSLWAGMIVLGDASINADATEIASGDGVVLTNQIEGLNPEGRHGLSLEEETSYLSYGGTDDDSSSGVLRYVSIRHSGISLTGEAGDEIQGLTLGGVGRGTVLENIEIFVSGDDGIEIFGGTANLRNIVLAYAEDDSLDLDQGWRGYVQNMVVMQSAFTDLFGESRDGDSGGEWDGADSPETNMPRALGVVSNATFIANEPYGASGDTTRGVRIRNGGANQVWNSLFLDYERWIQLDNNPENNIVQDQLVDGNTAFVGNVVYNGTDTAFNDSLIDANDFDASVDAVALISDAANKNQVVTDAPVSLSRESDGKVMLGAAVDGSPIYDGENVVALPQGGFLQSVDYIGAFDADDSWAAWTFSAEQGYIAIPGYVETESLGPVYTFSGNLLPEQWVYVAELESFAWLASDDADGSWIYIVK